MSNLTESLRGKSSEIHSRKNISYNQSMISDINKRNYAFFEEGEKR